MPTYQTAPLLPNVFADQASKLNPYGVQPLKGNVLKHLPLEPSAHPSWKQEADLRALAKVANTKMSEMAMLKGPQPFKAQTPYTTYRGPKGDAYSHSFTGGRVWTREAEGMVTHLLKDRIGQLNALDQSTFEQVAPERLQANIPETDTFPLDQYFSNLLSSLSEGLINSTLLGFSNSIMAFLLTKADKIPDHKFGQYKDIIGKIKLVIHGAFYKDKREGIYSAGDAKKMNSILTKLDKDMFAVVKFIEEYSDYLGSPTKTKSAKLAAMRGKLFGLSQINAQESVEASEALQNQLDEQRRRAEEIGYVGPPPNDGSTYDSSTYVPTGQQRRAPGQQTLDAFGFAPQITYAPASVSGSEAASAYSFPSGNTGLAQFEEVRNTRGVPRLSPGSVNSGYGRPLRRR